MAFDYPIVLELTGVPVLVVGGGTVALRKIEGLLAARAAVTTVAPDVVDEIRALPVRIITRAFEPSDLDAVRLVVTATDDPAVNAAVAVDAQRRGIWVNSADDPANCTFTLPAVARDGPVTVAVSTGGASPALASHLRGEIERWLDEIGAAEAAATLSAQRNELRARGQSTESVDWSERVRAALRPRP
ncbi:MAG: precorrin-2 dehydrogenase/sirohydrochlorin ferrochelatase family protein [Ilumatobacteraceae bacterium]